IASKYSWSMPMYLALPRRASSRVAIVSIDFASTSSVRPYTSSNGIPTPSSCDPQRSSGRIRGTKHYGRFAGIAGSIRFDARELHHLAPLFGLLGDELPKSAGEPGSAVAPHSASRAFILGSARAALISVLSLSTISAGVVRGAPMPVQKLNS